MKNIYNLVHLTEIAKNIEISKTAISQMIGLMFRSNIPADYAMIFPVKKPSFVLFHMFFMNFPIDIIFLDADKTIISMFHLKPWVSFCCKDNVRYVIETNAGNIEKYNLSEGDKLLFSGYF